MQAWSMKWVSPAYINQESQLTSAQYFQFDGRSPLHEHRWCLWRSNIETPNTLAEKKFTDLKPLTSGSEFSLSRTIKATLFTFSFTSARLFSPTHTIEQYLFPKSLRGKSQIWDTNRGTSCALFSISVRLDLLSACRHGDGARSLRDSSCIYSCPSNGG